MSTTIIEEFWLEAILVVIALSITLYYFWTAKYNYWKDRNIPYIQPTFPFGNTKEFILSHKFLGLVFKDLYFQLKGHKYGGVISVRRPLLILRDPDVIKQILTKDFNYFTDRGITVDEEGDPLSAHLFNLGGEKWRQMRVKLTPTFTSGKMKGMFHLMKACSEELKRSLAQSAEKDKIIEVKDVMARFGIDIIGSCAFGLDIDSINNPENEFRKISTKLLRQNFRAIIRNILNSVIPGSSKILGLRSNPKEREDFFFKIVGDTVKYREKNNVERNDFLDLLIQIKNKGKVEDESNDDFEKSCPSEKNINGKTVSQNSNDIHLTNELMTAQCFVFFVAGYETSSTTLSFCLYELAINKSLQKRLQDEIDNILAKHKGEISYESLKEMTYMDQVVQETLRKYPPVAVLSRECVSDYLLKEGNLLIKKGTRISIPLYGLHYDPEYYPEPDRFDPERFSDEMKRSRHHYTWLAFGEGPRNCIGMRFGLLQVKIGLATLLSNYNFDRTEETQVPIKLSNKSFVTSPQDGIKIRISKRTKLIPT